MSQTRELTFNDHNKRPMKIMAITAYKLYVS